MMSKEPGSPHDVPEPRGAPAAVGTRAAPLGATAAWRATMTTVKQGEQVWLEDAAEGYVPGELLAPSDAAGCAVRLVDGSTRKLTAGEQKAPHKVDSENRRAHSDMLHFGDLSEAPLLHNLRLRFDGDEIYTSVGDILVALNPFQVLPIYGADKVERFLKQQGEKDEKHVFLTADAAYFSGVVDVKMHQKMSDCEREI